jgi:hypothetical protein
VTQLSECICIAQKVCVILATFKCNLDKGNFELIKVGLLIVHYYFLATPSNWKTIIGQFLHFCFKKLNTFKEKEGVNILVLTNYILPIIFFKNLLDLQERERSCLNLN